MPKNKRDVAVNGIKMSDFSSRHYVVRNNELIPIQKLGGFLSAIGRARRYPRIAIDFARLKISSQEISL